MKHRYLSPIIGSVMWSAIFTGYIFAGVHIPGWLLWCMVFNICILSVTGYMEDREIEEKDRKR